MAGDPRKGLEKDRCQELLQAAIDLADVLRERISEEVGQGLTVASKADHSVVTSADTAGEQALRAAVIARYPAHGVRGEELPTAESRRGIRLGRRSDRRHGGVCRGGALCGAPSSACITGIVRWWASSICPALEPARKRGLWAGRHGQR